MSACGGGYGAGIARSAGIVLVLFILLVIILAAAFAI
ncbi:sporulation protein YjcZ [Chengkuizengella sediminis]|nr:sporulation protein YjcZ [Chengkuizengella sediminis]